MNRRHFLAASAALAAGGVAVVWPEQGWMNPCKAALPPEVAGHEVVRAAWAGIDAARVIDCHVHLVGVGDNGSGVWVHPQMDSLLNPWQYVQKIFYLNAGCVHDAPGRVDQSFVERMHNLVDGMAPGAKLLLLAFDWFHDEAGRPQQERSTFHTPNEYAERMAREHPAYFEWAASIHPHRPDCIDALERAAASGARAVKWLPAAMGIDPASSRCDRFYDALARLRIPLISHAGRELAVEGSLQDFGNPLRLRRALERGVRVVVAHCASDGDDVDLDKGADGPRVPSFELFARLMDDPRWQSNLYADISAVTQLNRVGVLRKVLERTDWHPRLINGSDYPLPGIMPLFSVGGMVRRGLLDPAAAPAIQAIREHNPLLFDFVLKRSLRAGEARFPASVFETRGFFTRAS